MRGNIRRRPRAGWWRSSRGGTEDLTFRRAGGRQNRWAGGHGEWCPRYSRYELAEVSPVSEVDASGTVNTHHVLVKLADFHNDTSLVPFGWVRAGLVLNTHRVPDGQWWEMAGVLGEAFGSLHVSVAECFLPGD